MKIKLWEAIRKIKTKADDTDYKALCGELTQEITEERVKRIAAERQRDMAAAKLGGNTKAHWVAMETGKNNFRAFKKSTAALCVMIDQYTMNKDLSQDGELLNIANQSDFLVEKGAYNPSKGFIPEHRMAAISDSSIKSDEDYIASLKEVTKFMSRDDFESIPVVDECEARGRHVIMDDEEWVICTIDGFRKRYKAAVAIEQ